MNPTLYINEQKMVKNKLKYLPQVSDTQPQQYIIIAF